MIDLGVRIYFGYVLNPKGVPALGLPSPLTLMKASFDSTFVFCATAVIGGRPIGSLNYSSLS